MSKRSKILSLFFVISFVFVLTGVVQLQAQEKAVCPVMGKEFTRTDATTSYAYEGITYYFCCPECKDKFVKDPEKYTQKKAETKEVYTCPMHPEVKSEKPGECPKCGMKLEMMKDHIKLTHREEQEHKEHMHGEGQEHEHMIHKEAEEKVCCPLMGFKDAEVKIENTKDGITMTITSKNADVVKKIQETAAKIKDGSSGTCCEKKEHKEETKK